MFLKEYFEKVKFEKVRRKQQKHGKLPSMQFLTSQFSKFKHILLAMEVTELFRALITDVLDERKEKKIVISFYLLPYVVYASSEGSWECAGL